MDDIKNKVQAKVKEMRTLNHELKEKYPQLSNNSWFDVILNKIKEGCFTDQFCSDFSPSDDNLNQIDQAAHFFNIDYSLYYDYERSFPINFLLGYVKFDFSKSYNQQKSRQEQQTYKEINKKQLHKNDICCAISYFCMVSSVMLAILALLGVMIPFTETLALITFVVGIISGFINNYQIRQIRDLIKNKM